MARGTNPTKKVTTKEVSKNINKGKEPIVVTHTVTEDDLTTNPDLATKGIKVGDVIDFVPLTKEQIEAQNLANSNKGTGDDKGKKDKVKNELDEKMKPYLEAYPTNKTFYITQDGQVFLEANKIDAGEHQRTLSKTEALQEYTR